MIRQVSFFNRQVKRLTAYLNGPRIRRSFRRACEPALFLPKAVLSVRCNFMHISELRRALKPVALRQLRIFLLFFASPILSRLFFHSQ